MFMHKTVLVSCLDSDIVDGSRGISVLFSLFIPIRLDLVQVGILARDKLNAVGWEKTH